MKMFCFCVVICLLFGCAHRTENDFVRQDQAYMALAAAYLQQGQGPLALQTLWRVSDSGQQSQPFVRLKGLQLLQSADDIAAAISYHEQAVLVFMQDAFLLNNLGVLYAHQGGFQRACELFLQAVKVSGQTSQAALINLSRCHIRQGMVKKAWQRLQEAKEIAKLPYIGLLTELNLVLIQGNINRARQLNTIIQAIPHFARDTEHLEEFDCLSRQVFMRESDLSPNSSMAPLACVVQGI